MAVAPDSKARESRIWLRKVSADAASGRGSIKATQQAQSSFRLRSVQCRPGRKTCPQPEQRDWNRNAHNPENHRVRENKRTPKASALFRIAQQTRQVHAHELAQRDERGQQVSIFFFRDEHEQQHAANTPDDRTPVRQQRLDPATRVPWPECHTGNQ